SALAGGARPYVAAAAPVSPAIPRRMPGPAAEVPPSRLAPRASAASAAASGVPAYQQAFDQYGSPGGAIPVPRPEFSGQPAFAQPGGRGEWPDTPPEDDFAAVYANLPASAHTGETPRIDPSYGEASTLSFSLD